MKAGLQFICSKTVVCRCVCIYSKHIFPSMRQANKSQDAGPSSSTSNGKQAEEEPDDEDIDVDDDLDLDELNELEASLSRTSIQIREPGEGTSS
uniref:Uncharacterized protein n=1 Tax=Arundo donax TaxID=35708 RepID=A0A0A9DTH2_ARUDO